MSTLTFRNSQGALVDIPTVAATQVKNEFGAILDQATRSGAVAITRHDTPKAVLKRLVKRSATKIVLEQYNPAKKFEIKSDDIVSIHRVVGSGES